MLATSVSALRQSGAVVERQWGDAQVQQSGAVVVLQPALVVAQQSGPVAVQPAHSRLHVNAVAGPGRQTLWQRVNVVDLQAR